MIPYGKQTIDDDDINAVAATLRSDRLTQGPKVQEFEEALASYCGASHAVVFSSGTAALQGAYHASGLQAGDEIITTPLTFAATANAALWQDLRPVFADIDPSMGNLDPQAAQSVITLKTKAVVPVDFAGLPVDLDRFKKIAHDRGLLLIEDACHALGASYKGKKIGAIGDITTFSFHPVKSITTGEGGAVLTNEKKFYDRLLQFRNHGIKKADDWEYWIEELGENFRITDLQCALGISQLKKLDRFIARRRALAQRYQEAFKSWEEIEPVASDQNSESSWHFYVLRLREPFSAQRREIFRALREAGIWVQVHYIPVYWHPLYQKLGYKKGLCPKAEKFYEGIISLPLYPTLTEKEQDHVIRTLRGILDRCYASSHRR